MAAVIGGNGVLQGEGFVVLVEGVSVGLVLWLRMFRVLLCQF